MTKKITSYVLPQILKLSPYQPGKPIETLAEEFGLEPSTIAKMASNENPLGPSPKAIDAMKEVAKEMHLYPDGNGMELKKALSTHYQLPVSYFALGDGSNELLVLLTQLFICEKRSCVMSQFSFAIYHLATSLFCGESIEVPMNKGFTHDLRAMKRAITSKTRIVFICNPNNPTGTFVKRTDLERFLDYVPKDVLVVLDEAYAEIALNSRFPETLDLVEKYENLVILRSFSKTYGLAGLRIGFAIAQPQIIELIERVRQPFNTSRIAQKAAIAALEDQKFVGETIRHYRRSRHLFEQTFKILNLEYVPSCTNFVLVKVGKGKKIFDLLQRKGLIVRPMDGYHLPEWIRISYGTMDENKRLVSALTELLQ